MGHITTTQTKEYIMINDLQQLKSFMEWCKKNKVKSVKLKDLEFELSELSFIDSTDSYVDELETAVDESKFEADQQTQDDDETLFWSAN